MDLHFPFLPVGGLRLASFLAALLAHRVFNKHESYSPVFNIALLLVPSTLITAFTTLQPQHNDLYYGSLLAAYAVSLSTYLAALLASVVLYRLAPFHPLAKYPGPLGARISKFWMAAIGVGGRSHVYIKSLHEKYASDVVRIGPNELSIRDPDAIPSILGAPGLGKGPHFIGRFLRYDAETLISLQDTDWHLQRRRPWARGLAGAAIKEYEALVSKRARMLVDRLEAQPDAVSLGKWFEYFSFDFMTDMAFGGGSELLSGEDKSNFWKILEESALPAMFLANVPWLGVFVGYVPAAVQALNILLAHCQTLTKKRIQRGSETRDLFHYLNHEDTPSRPPPPSAQLVDDGILAMVAGADTVSSALTSLFLCLLTNPDAYARLEAEVDRFYPRGSDPMDSRCHPEMTWLSACINEALRIFPPVPSCTQRCTPSTGSGMTVGSTYIPPGTNVWMHVFSMHRDARNFFPHPEGFWPERWLRASGRDDSAAPAKGAAGGFVHNEQAFIPFSYGPMNCVGKNLALYEIRTVVCALVQRFRVRWVGAGREGVETDFVARFQEYDAAYKDYFISFRGPVSVVLEVRQ